MNVYSPLHNNLKNLLFFYCSFLCILCIKKNSFAYSMINFEKKIHAKKLFLQFFLLILSNVFYGIENSNYSTFSLFLFFIFFLHSFFFFLNSNSFSAFCMSQTISLNLVLILHFLISSGLFFFLESVLTDFSFHYLPFTIIWMNGYLVVIKSLYSPFNSFL